MTVIITWNLTTVLSTLLLINNNCCYYLHKNVYNVIILSWWFINSDIIAFIIKWTIANNYSKYLYIYIIRLSDKSGLTFSLDTSPLLLSEPIQGECRVMCYHPHTNVTLATMTLEQVRTVIDKWAEICEEMKHKHMWIQVI